MSNRSESLKAPARHCLNREWKFLRADEPKAAAVDFDDASWQAIGLPHTFDLPYFRTPEFYVGAGWYRRQFSLSLKAGQQAILEFVGAFQVCDVFLNGQKAGRHSGGYTPFFVDITELVKEGENVLAVRVDNLWNAQLAPRAGEHIFSGGLYRDVYLHLKNALYLPCCATRITTPSVSKSRAEICVRTQAVAADDDISGATIATEILDPDGELVAEEIGESTVEEQRFEIENPKLWHPDHPHLYTARVTLLKNGQVTDTEETRFGIRWFEWTADRGFFLNGESLYLRGVNAHQDQAGWGIAATANAQRRDVQIIKDAGFNFLRGAHYPHHPACAQACDEIGLLFWSENCFWGKGGFGPEGYWNASAFPVNEADFKPFSQSCKQTLKEMITTQFNHPSIIAWSMTNEAFFTYHVDKARQLVKELVELSRELDPTRPAAVGGAQRGDFDHIGDIAGYNGDGARLFIDPGVPNMVSEYGAVSKGQPGEFGPYYGDLQMERFAWRSGQAIWCGFDYGTIAGKQGLKGIVDHFRLPKRSWYWYRKEYLGTEPPLWPIEGEAARLQLHAGKTTLARCDGTDDCLLTVTLVNAAGVRVNSSLPVTLTIVSGPGEFPTGRSITFEADSDIRISGGEAAIAFRSYHGGVSEIRATSPDLIEATIRIWTEGEPKFIEGETAVAADRPYVPPVESEAARAAAQNAVNVARDRPSRASSEHAEHPARSGNDGKDHTAWLAAESVGESGVGQWWQVDLEGFYQIASNRVTFGEEGNFRFIIETSHDGKNWTEMIDRRKTENAKSTRNDIYPPGATARYLRLTFTHVPAGMTPSIRDLQVFGVLSLR